MANYTLKAGRHYHGLPPFSTLPWLGEQSIQRHVTFSPECAYDSAPYNGQDVNKLFGLSFGLRGVHHNSARFGWRWSNGDQCIELLAYCYANGERNWDAQLRFPVVAQVRPGQTVTCRIALTEYKGRAAYLFDVEGVAGQFVPVFVRCPYGLPHWGLTHGPYFGGALAAPHTMVIQLDRP